MLHIFLGFDKAPLSCKHGYWFWHYEHPSLWALSSTALRKQDLFFIEVYIVCRLRLALSNGPIGVGTFPPLHLIVEKKKSRFRRVLWIKSRRWTMSEITVFFIMTHHYQNSSDLTVVVFWNCGRIVGSLMPLFHCFRSHSIRWDEYECRLGKDTEKDYGNLYHGTFLECIWWGNGRPGYETKLNSVALVRKRTIKMSRGQRTRPPATIPFK
jgi:hypothetical protein